MSFFQGYYALKSVKSMRNLHKSVSICRPLSTSSSLILNKSPSILSNQSFHRPSPIPIPFGTSVRYFFRPRDPYKIKPPCNLGINFVPEQKAYVVQRFGKYFKTLDPGFHFLIPFIYRISYVHSMKEQIIPISSQTAITKDNVPITIDGVLNVRIIDPILASYGVENPIFSVVQLAQTTMRSELGKITLDKTFRERKSLNKKILNAINDWPLRTDWGLECLRYEIKDISPPKGVKAAMNMQSEAERRMRAKVIDSEGCRQEFINIADGNKTAMILQSEAAKMDQVNRAKGEAKAIIAYAQATAKGISEVSRAIIEKGGVEAAKLRIAEQYLDSFDEILEKGTTMLIPDNAADIASMIAQSAAIYKQVSNKFEQPVSKDRW